MASFLPNVTHQRSLMLTATAQRRLMVTICVCFLLVAGGSSAEVQSCGKKELVFYGHQDQVPPGQTIVISASPSGTGAVEFGTIIVFDNVLREGAANDSTPVGRSRGLVTVEQDLTIFTTFTYDLTIPGCTGSLSAQGTSGLPAQGLTGEFAITGGTGAFRFVLGYFTFVTVSTDPEDVVVQNTVHLKYL